MVVKRKTGESKASIAAREIAINANKSSSQRIIKILPRK
jgi:hypothetical protein